MMVHAKAVRKGSLHRVGQTGCEVVTGYYNDGNEGQSVAIPNGVKKDIPGMTLQTLDLEEGFWRKSPDSVEIYECLNSKHCKGGVNTTDLCSDGYSGPLCAVCASGYAAVGSQQQLTCETCSGVSDFKIYVVFVGVALLFASIFYFIFRQSNESTQELIRSQSEYWFFWLYAIAMIFVYPLGIPGLYTYLLRDKMEKLEAGQAKFEEEMGAKEALEKALEVRTEHEKTDPELRALTFLYESYEPKYWWFEILETGRKLCLTGFLVFLAPRTATQIVMSMTISIMTTRVYSGAKPFISDFNDRFAEVAMWQIFFTMFGALAIRVDLDGESLQDRWYFDMFLTLIQFLPLLIVVFMNDKIGATYSYDKETRASEWERLEGVVVQSDAIGIEEGVAGGEGGFEMRGLGREGG
ncbi:hypothetical protein TrST_g857 [Triparma strigata]|uniref:Uncharacterized protein n=1 Tax=Triparma strigata TaxID=1606541 RepID=A0A9W7BCW9_9STRA|nr:hypothetical protein TrST_g857 [Triparma strigata]